MLKKILLSSILFSQALNLGLKPCGAEDFSPIKTINSIDNFSVGVEKIINLNTSKSFDKFINLNQNNEFFQLINANDRFVQCNIKASWNDFKNMIELSEPNDFTYISLANKLSNIGFFDLANLAGSKVQDKEFSKISLESMRKFYHPKKRLKFEDELFLAEIYSNIVYNNQSTEATSELMKNKDILAKSDYANYLAALGYYKSDSLTDANKYINIATAQNPSNLNYQKLKAEILADGNKPEQALKTVEYMKRQKPSSFEYERKILAAEQYILYKITKAEWEKNYHLGFYHHLENDNYKAIKTLQTAIASSKKKSTTAVITSLMSKIYLEINESEKALEYAKKTVKTNKNDSRALITLGDLSYNSKNYKQALNYYKQASSQNKTSVAPFVREAQAYQKLGNTKKAIEIYTKIIKTHLNNFQTYYNLALLESGQTPEQKVKYLKQALAINPLFKEGWIELAKIEINKTNYDEAKKYLSNAFYIDENDFRYYYYNGLANKGLGDYNQAQYDFKKCLKINTKCTEAQQELQQTFNVEL